MPRANMLVMSEDPPEETSGSGTPMTGQEPDDGADVDERLDDAARS